MTDKNLDFNKKYEQIENLFHKLQIENVSKNLEISRLREEIQKYRKTTKDTSGNFPLPDEFKTRWETLIKTSIMDSLENISLNFILLMKVINIIVKLIYDISKIKIKEKISEILKCLGINNNKEENIKNFFDKFKILIFQDYFNTIFKIKNEEFTNEIVNNIKNEIIYKESKLFSSEEKKNILKDLKNKNIEKFIIEIYYLCLYMNINDPQLIIRTSTEINYKYYSKKKYSNIEGFSNENDICLLLLNPPVTKSNFNYKGIKPTVCIIDNPTEEIKKLCEKQNNPNKQDEIKELAKSFYKPSNYINYFRSNKIAKDKDNKSQLLIKRNISINNFSNDFSLNSFDKCKVNNSFYDRIKSKDDFFYNYKYNFDNILKNIISINNCKSYKSEFLNINHNKFKKLYKGLAFPKKNCVINKIHNLKRNQERNISFLSFHDSHIILKNLNKIGKNPIQKKSKSNKSSSPISPRKSPSFLFEKDKNNIRKIISMINSRNQQKSKNYKSEKFLRNKRKLILNKENSNLFLKIKDIKQLQEYSCYARKNNKKMDININKEEGKTVFNDTIEDKSNITKNISTLKETIPMINNEYEKNLSNLDSKKIKINKIIIKKQHIPFTNIINQSEPNISIVEDIKLMKNYVQIPKNNIINKKENLLFKEKYLYNKDNSNSFIYCNNINCNLNTNNIYFKTNNNSILSNYNIESEFICNKNNCNKNIHKNIKSKEYNNNNNSLSIQKLDNKNKNFSSNGIRIKKKKNIFNKNDNNIEHYGKESKSKNDKNKYNSNYNLYNKKKYNDSSQLSIISSNSQLNIHANKNLYNIIKPENQIKDNKNKKMQKKCILLCKKNFIDINSKKKQNENSKIKLNTEKNQDNYINIDSLRNINKVEFEVHHPKNEKNNYVMNEKSSKYNSKKNNDKKFSTFLSDNKENKNNNRIKTKIKNNMYKYDRNITNENRKKSKDPINNDKKYYLNNLLTFNEKIIANNI